MTPDHNPSDLKIANTADDRHFNTERLKVDLGRRTARGGLVTVVSQGMKFVLSMGATVVLARLLTPQDYGLIGMVAVVTGFVAMFKDLGLSTATVQREEINAAQISTLFWINVALSVAVMLITAALAPAIAWFYGEPRLTLITLAYASGFLIGGLSVQHGALLYRQMRFVALAVIEIVSLVVSIATAIGLAWYGARYWALVGSQLTTVLTNMVGVWALCRWRPGLPARGSGVGPMLAFGRNLTGFTIVNYFARNLDNLLIGKFWGSQQLGLYAKAYQLLLLPLDQINTPIASVAVPVLSRLADAPDRYRMAYLRILEKVAILTMPGVAFMIVTSDWIVKIALGPQWLQASRIFAVLGVAGLVQPILNTLGWLYITQDRAHDMFRWGVIASTLIIASIIVGLPWGAMGVAVSYSITFLFVLSPLAFWYVGRSGPVRTRDLYKTALTFGSATLFSLVVLIAFRIWSGVHDPLLGIGICLPLSGGATLTALALFPAGRRALRDIKDSLILLFKRRQMI